MYRFGRCPILLLSNVICAPRRDEMQTATTANANASASANASAHIAVKLAQEQSQQFAEAARVYVLVNTRLLRWWLYVRVSHRRAQHRCARLEALVRTLVARYPAIGAEFGLCHATAGAPDAAAGSFGNSTVESVRNPESLAQPSPVAYAVTPNQPTPASAPCAGAKRKPTPSTRTVGSGRASGCGSAHSDGAGATGAPAASISTDTGAAACHDCSVLRTQVQRLQQVWCRWCRYRPPPYSCASC